MAPPPVPAHDQLHGPEPDSTPGVPARHRLLGGVLRTCPSSLPHRPSCGPAASLTNTGSIAQLAVSGPAVKTLPLSVPGQVRLKVVNRW